MFLIRLFLIFIFIGVIINFLVRVILPWRLKKMAEKMQNQAQDQQNEYRRSQKKEGDITIDKQPKGQQNDNFKDKGEYVDFEEVD